MTPINENESNQEKKEVINTSNFPDYILRNKRNKYIAVFVINQNDIPTIIRTKRFNPTSEIIKFRKNSFVIDIEKPSYTKNNKKFYFFSLKANKQIAFEGCEQPTIDSETIDIICNKKIVQQLTANLNDTFKPNLMILIVGICIGAIIGYLYCQYSLTNAQNTDTSGILITLFKMIKLLRLF